MPVSNAQKAQVIVASVGRKTRVRIKDAKILY